MGAGTYNGTLTDRGVALGYGATSISYDESGVLSLTKVGEETLTLGGTVSYTGLTDIQGGTLALTASGATSLYADSGYQLRPRSGRRFRGRNVQSYVERT